MPEVTIGAYSFQGEQIYWRDHPADDVCGGATQFRLLIYRVDPDSPIVAEGGAPHRVQGVGGYLLAVLCPGQSEPIFEVHYQTLADLRDGSDGRNAPAFEAVRVAIEDALDKL